MSAQSPRKVNSADLEASNHYLSAQLEDAERESKRLSDILIALLKRLDAVHTFTEQELAADDGRRLMIHEYADKRLVEISLHRWQNEAPLYEAMP